MYLYIIILYPFTYFYFLFLLNFSLFSIYLFSFYYFKAKIIHILVLLTLFAYYWHFFILFFLKLHIFYSIYIFCWLHPPFFYLQPVDIFLKQLIFHREFDIIDLTVYKLFISIVIHILLIIVCITSIFFTISLYLFIFYRYNNFIHIMFTLLYLMLFTKLITSNVYNYWLNYSHVDNTWITCE